MACRASRWTEYASVDALPESARALLGADFFSTADWYRTVVSAGLPARTRPVFLAVHGPDAAAAVFPMLARGRTASSLTTPYTGRWQPLIAAGDEAERAPVWGAFAAWCRGFASVRLDAMEEEMAACIADGLRGVGLARLPFRHFGNWHGRAADGWPAYLSERPGQLREAIRRRGKRLMADGGTFRMVSRPDEIEAGIEAYEQVYARSWKPAEPFPAFNPTLMRACAHAGTLRLGLICRGGAVLAAQIWVVHGRWAAVLKLAHDEAQRGYSPGTVLTAMMIEHLLTEDGITALDFGRGDDAYKKDWVAARRQRRGLVLANPTRADGIALIVQAWGGRILRRFQRA
jgi:hypothetical protein